MQFKLRFNVSKFTSPSRPVNLVLHKFCNNFYKIKLKIAEYQLRYICFKEEINIVASNKQVVQSN